MSLEKVLSSWQTDPLIAPNLPVWRTLPPRPADLRPFPPDLPPVLAEALRERGIISLYSHQSEAWTHIRAGQNVVLATSTASGKTLGYNLPVLAALLDDPQARALYLFPTKALTQDQLAGIHQITSALHRKSSIHSLQTAIYDGDTSQSHRPAIRQKSRIILTNPDMLHTGILPHHTNWADFFRNLKFVVIDEVHTYRGVFGSHVANVLRRLKRVAKFYGAKPQFILTSATIGNPRELAERLIEEPVVLVDKDGSSRGERHFLIYNPPVVDPATGLRKSVMLESVRLAQDLLAGNVQTVVFARSRRSVEILLKYLQENREQRLENSGSAENYPQTSNIDSLSVRGYRSGYLPSQRRAIEKGLRDGSVRAVVATNALELGIDIGGLEAALLVGYPGTIASTWQQAGRAGRGDAPAVAVFLASALPLDQFLVHHPDYFFRRSPEQALINPDHMLILLNHLRCAMFELPFEQGEIFGGQPVDEYLEFLVTNNESHFSKNRFFWMADSYPAAGISLRSASPDNVILHVNDGGAPRTIGEVDLASAAWMVHPRAIYLHEGQQYYVQELNLETNNAALIPVALDYYTDPQRQTDIKILTENAKGETASGSKGWGEMQVTAQVVGFRKLRWFTHENLGMEPLDLPPTEFQTTGYWLSLSEQALETLHASGVWSADPNDYGPGWDRLRDAVRLRDGYCCQVCGLPESTLAGAGGRRHDVHHKTPFRAFTSAAEANRLENLVTLCASCHKKVEQNVHIRSGLAGLAYVLGQLAPLFLMCDPGDLGVHFDPEWVMADGLPSVAIYDDIPGGIGFSQKIFEMHDDLMKRALELVEECGCEDGCPSCVGPGGENGVGGKAEAAEILKVFCPRG